MIPAPVVELYEAHAILDQSSGQQAIVGKGGVVALVEATRVSGRFGFRNVTGLGSIQFQDMVRFLFQIHHFGDRHLHTEGQLVLGYARQGLGVTHVLVLVLVEIPDRIERLSASLATQSFGVGEIEDRIPSVRPALHALVEGWEESGSPKRFSCARGLSSRGKDHEARKVFIVASQTVGDPGAHGGVTQKRISGLQKELGGRMIELFGVHGADDADVVNDRA